MPSLFKLDYPEPRREEKRKKSVLHSSKKYSFNRIEHRKVLIEAREEKKCPWYVEKMAQIKKEFKRYRLVIKQSEMFVEEIYTEIYSYS